MDKVKIAIIGVGGMGCDHIDTINKLENAELVALCDVNRKQVKALSQQHNCPAFTDYRKLLEADLCDAVIIATPHYDHTEVGIDALQAGRHVLVEKPISVHKADAQRLTAAHRSVNQVFATVFQLRTKPEFLKIKELIDSGQLGQITRVNWIITSWFRSDYYYSTGKWRATWAGEGGGVLLNQCPHNLDMLWWLFGMPSRVRAFCHLGKWHAIEVEDDVTAYLEYPNGGTGVFTTNTGEAPGTDRLEIAADNGKVVLEDGKITFYRNETPAAEFRRTSKAMFARPEVSEIDIPVSGVAGGNSGIVANFLAAILDDEEPIAPAEQGMHSVELANAMLYSSLTDSTIELPLDGEAFEQKLCQLIKQSLHTEKRSEK